MKLDPTNTELLAQKQRLLQSAIKETETRLDSLKAADKQAKKQLESGDLGQDKYDALQREIVATEQKLDGLNDQLKKTGTGGLTTQLSGLSSKAKAAGDAIQPLSTAAAGLGGAMLATVPATEELRSDLSKLDNNARDAGVGIDETRAAFEAFNTVSDETDSSVEATSNLLQAGFTESNLQKAVEGLSGAYLRFPDTLKIESLADSLQETLATGTATGQFGELLDRLGIGADNFSASLAECTTDAEKQNKALQTLADAGLIDTYNGCKENNSVLVESKNANLELQESLSEMANTLQPIMTKAVQVITKIVDAFNSMSPAAQGFILALIGIVAAAAPILSILGSVGAAVTGLGTAMLPVIGIIAGVVAAIGIIIAIIQNWGAITEWFGNLWTSICNGVESVWSSVSSFLSSTLDGIISFIKNGFNSIKSTITNVMDSIENTIISIWTAIYENPIVQTIVETVEELFTGLKNTLSSIWTNLKNIASNLWTLIKNVILAPVLLLIDLVTGDFESLKSDAQNIWNNMKTAASNIWSSIKNLVSSLASSLASAVVSAVTNLKNTVSSLW